MGIDQYDEVILGEKVLILRKKFLVQTRDDSNIRTIEQSIVQWREHPWGKDENLNRIHVLNLLLI